MLFSSEYESAWLIAIEQVQEDKTISQPSTEYPLQGFLLINLSTLYRPRQPDSQSLKFPESDTAALVIFFSILSTYKHQSRSIFIISMMPKTPHIR